MFITPDTGLREQAYQSFSTWFGKENVSKKLDSSTPIIVSNIQALKKDPEEFERFGLVILDEFHHSGAKTYMMAMRFLSNAYYRYGLTGTFMRSDGKDMEMHGVLSEVIMEKGASELIEEGFLVRPYITIVRHETSPEYGYKCSYRDAYDHIIRDESFHHKASTIANRKIKEKKQTLILVRRVEHGEALAELIPDAVFLHGSIKKKEINEQKQAFNEKKIPAIIATSIFGEGTDIPSIDCLINARCEKTEIQTKQGIGRTLRKAKGKEKAEVYDFLIMGNKHLENHSAERIKSYKKEPAFRITVTKEF